MLNWQPSLLGKKSYHVCILITRTCDNHPDMKNNEDYETKPQMPVVYQLLVDIKFRRKWETSHISVRATK